MMYGPWDGAGIDIGSRTNDYDGDGIQNLIEFALGGNPTNANDNGTSPSCTIQNDGVTMVMRYVYPKRSDPNSGLTYRLETTDSLQPSSWTNAGYIVEGTYVTGGDFDYVTNVVEIVLKQKHVRPVVFIDKELDDVEKKFAPGIDDLREQIKSVLHNRNVQTEPHEAIIKQLDQAENTFRALLIKTDLTLPYTSVFLRLDCGYWSDEAEASLRENMK